jgi:hypothetical protein
MLGDPVSSGALSSLQPNMLPGLHTQRLKWGLTVPAWEDISTVLPACEIANA